MGVTLVSHEGLLLFGLFKIFLGMFYLALFFFFRKIKKGRPVSKVLHFSYSFIIIFLYFGLIILNCYLELPGSQKEKIILNIPLSLLLILNLIYTYYEKKKEIEFKNTPTDIFAIWVGVMLVILGTKSAFY